MQNPEADDIPMCPFASLHINSLANTISLKSHTQYFFLGSYLTLSISTQSQAQGFKKRRVLRKVSRKMTKNLNAHNFCLVTYTQN